MTGALFISLPAHATPPLVADLSNYRILIDSNFNGTRLFLFGARNDPGDIVVVVRGPQKNFVLRKKEQIAGIWVNRDRIKFYHTPDFYAIAANKPLAEIEENGLFSRLGINETNLIATPQNLQLQQNFTEFSQAFLQHQHDRKLYSDVGQINFMGETLFKTVIEFPDNIPPGRYTAEIYLISDGEVTGMQSTPITVVKTGFDAALYRYAHREPALYGIAAILVALSAGWLAGRLFEKA